MRVALVDDNDNDRKRLADYLQQFQQEQGVRLQITSYSSSLDFLEEYKGGYDVILLDIEMPGMDGMETAREIRAIDEMVAIIFITNMAQYAIRGYEVNAVDFMVKPVPYFKFAEKFKRAASLSEREQGGNLLLNTDDGVVKVAFKDIYYLEKDKNKNYLVYYTKKGTFRERNTVQSAKAKLGEQSFAECISGCLVNLRYVERVGKDSVILENAELPVSRRMRKDFLNSFMKYAGGY
jgi:DNA-binding LytR/AlgR family response regulator